MVPVKTDKPNNDNNNMDEQKESIPYPKQIDKEQNREKKNNDKYKNHFDYSK